MEPVDLVNRGEVWRAWTNTLATPPFLSESLSATERAHRPLAPTLQRIGTIAFIATQIVLLPLRSRRNP